MIAELRAQQRLIVEEQKKLRQMFDEYKNKYAFKIGTKIELKRTVFNVEKLKEEEETYNLFIKRINIDEITLEFKYLFAKINKKGTLSKDRCSIYHNKGDRIREI